MELEPVPRILHPSSQGLRYILASCEDTVPNHTGAQSWWWLVW